MIGESLQRTLRLEGHAVDWVRDAGAADGTLASERFDLVLLDLGLPRGAAGAGPGDGLEVLKAMRARHDATPVIVLTARDARGDRVAGLDAGADDYLVKPFATDELLARMRALLRRGRPAGDLLSVGDVTLDLRGRSGSRAGRDLALTPREADLLELLLLNARGVVSRDQALQHVWQGGAATANAVDRYVAYLRRKLGDPPLIRTVRGVGFVFEP